MESGDTMFIAAVIVGMALFAVTLFGVTMFTNGRQK
jgi:hypothetical protein